MLYIHTYIHTHGPTPTHTYNMYISFDECADGIGCYSRYFFPFGNENDDVLSGLIKDGSISIQLNTDFVFHNTSYTSVFVSLKLVTYFLVFFIIKIWV